MTDAKSSIARELAGSGDGPTATPRGGLRPPGGATGSLGEGLAGAGEIVCRSARRSGEEAGEAREARRETRRNVQSGPNARPPRGSGVAALFDAADEVRSQSFLGAWTLLAAGERLGRSVVGPDVRRGGPVRGMLPDAFSARTLALGAAALDLYTGYAALRERKRWFPGLVRGSYYELQHSRGAGRALDAARALGATLIKAGQFASSRPDLLPPAYVSSLSTLQDRVPPRPFKVVRRVIEEQIGAPLYRTFFSIDPEPIAAASIAQVHRARLSDGREVAVKVRYPEVAGLVEEDLTSLEAIFDVVGRLEPEVQLQTSP